MSRLQWIDKLASRALRVGQLLDLDEIADLAGYSSGLREHLTELARLLMEV